MARIFCPRCHWKPRPHHRWICEPSCRHTWNTFDTRGQCPRCLKQWTETQCLTSSSGCGQFSPHEDWYHDEDGADERLRGLIESEVEIDAPLEPQKVGA